MASEQQLKEAWDKAKAEFDVATPRPDETARQFAERLYNLRRPEFTEAVSEGEIKVCKFDELSKGIQQEWIKMAIKKGATNA